ncbi:hypothetical protein [Candidatus Protofrankia datiscae]|nr:hypothetical protein [Candidatus Protofrankia datiscae]
MSTVDFAILGAAGGREAGIDNGNAARGPVGRRAARVAGAAAAAGPARHRAPSRAHAPGTGTAVGRTEHRA